MGRDESDGDDVAARARVAEVSGRRNSSRRRRGRGGRKKQADTVVKVQTPIMGDLSNYLIYDRERSFTMHIEVGSSHELDAAMNGHLKRYFGACFVPDPQPDAPDAVKVHIDPSCVLPGLDW